MPHPALTKVIVAIHAFEIMVQKADYLHVNGAWYSAPYGPDSTKVQVQFTRMIL